MVAKIIPEERECIACGETFLVGGAGRKKRSTLTCSQQCNGKVKTTTSKYGTPCNKLTEVQAAYLAGMIDADGSMGLYRRSGTTGYYRVLVCVSNTNKEMLEWIKEVTGVGSVQVQHLGSDRRKPNFQWMAAGVPAVTLLEQIKSYMVIKEPRADVVIGFWERKQQPGSRLDLSWQDEFKEKITEMNRRGPSRITSSIGENEV